MDSDRRNFLRRSLQIGAGGLLVPSFLGSGLSLYGQSGSTTPRRHTVQRGETLSGIAARYGVRVAEIQRHNQLVSDRILVGQVLIIPSPESSTIVHKVRPGDTLSGLAQQYGTTVNAIKTRNGLRSDTIQIGQELTIERGTPGPRTYRYIQPVINATRNIHIQPGRWQWIVGHHSAIARGNAASYDRTHRVDRRMPNGLAYHFVIGNGRDSGDGEVEIGNRWTQQLQGGHVRNAQVNMTGIGICLVGNFEETRPSQRQLEAFIELVSYLKNDLLTHHPVRFAVHREVDRNHTLCPGRHFPTRDMHRRFN